MSGLKLDHFTEAGLGSTERAGWWWGLLAALASDASLEAVDGWTRWIFFSVIIVGLSALSMWHAPRRGRAAYRVTRDEATPRAPR